MGMATPALTSVEHLAEALFVSPLQPSERPSADQVRAAIWASLRTYGDPTGCAARFAAEFGEHPEEAVVRMRWALELAAE